MEKMLNEPLAFSVYYNIERVRPHYTVYKLVPSATLFCDAPKLMKMKFQRKRSPGIISRNDENKHSGKI